MHSYIQKIDVLMQAERTMKSLVLCMHRAFAFFVMTDAGYLSRISNIADSFGNLHIDNIITMPVKN